MIDRLPLTDAERAEAVRVRGLLAQVDASYQR